VTQGSDRRGGSGILSRAMIVFFIHQNFPAQYLHIAGHLAAIPQNRIYFITQSEQNQLPRVIKLIYKPDLAASPCHPYTGAFDLAVRTGTAVAEVCRKLRQGGIVPDVIVGHAGWGETLFVKDVFPDVPLLANFEYFYHASGADVGFDPEFAPPRPDDAPRLQVRNALNRMSFAASDWGHTATAWQRSLFPAEMQRRITMLHEGVDTARVAPDPDAWLKLARENITLTGDDEIITYVARNLEPYRGFHVFMRALPEILSRRPRAQVLIAGAEGISYGDPPPQGGTWRTLLENELADRLDLKRVHFLGHVSYELYLNLLQISSVHVYLSYPFVLSWSFIEAMAAGCLIVGAATDPVLEVLRDGENGLAVDFFDTAAIADRVTEALDQPDLMRPLRVAARDTALNDFDLERCILPQWRRLIETLAAGRRPIRRAPTDGLATRRQLR
jgi:glycosyltransferase involved in cell wall biosynthesis